MPTYNCYRNCIVSIGILSCHENRQRGSCNELVAADFIKTKIAFVISTITPDKMWLYETRNLISIRITNLAKNKSICDQRTPEATPHINYNRPNLKITNLFRSDPRDPTRGIARSKLVEKQIYLIPVILD